VKHCRRVVAGAVLLCEHREIEPFAGSARLS
jgi:hypothetical protein